MPHVQGTVQLTLALSSALDGGGADSTGCGQCEGGDRDQADSVWRVGDLHMYVCQKKETIKEGYRACLFAC